MIRKQKSIQNKGFTIIELLVVISIMVLMATILIVNYNGQRSNRNVKIAQSELVTNLRKVQSYTLSSRNVETEGQSVPVKYYMIEMNTGQNQYSVQNIDANFNANLDQEVVTLPQGIVLDALEVSLPNQKAKRVNKAQVIYAAPFGKVYVFSSNDSCAADVLAAVQNPGCLLSLGDKQLLITLRAESSGLGKTVRLYGVSGNIEIDK